MKMFVMGEVMSLRRCLVASAILFAFAGLTGCSSGNGSGITNPVAPPSGKFSNSNLTGTYVFSVSGIDNINGAPYALVGTFAANGSGGISGGAYDMNDAEFPTNSIAPVADQAISGGNYAVQVDGRTRVTLNASTPFGSSGSGSGIILDIVLQNSSHGLITQFDANATGSGTVDLQTAGATPTGTYAFSLSGAGVNSGEAFAAVGNFAIGSTGITGLADINEGGILALPNEPLTGSLSVGPSATPATILTANALNGTFDVFAIDATHLKLIEMDQTNILVGDAYAQTSPAMPVGTQAFTLAGCLPCGSSFTPSAIGGFMVTDANGNITNASTEDYNVGGTSPNSSSTFSGTYTAGGTGRYTLGSFATFVGGTTYAAYPSSGGLLLLEMDSKGLTVGAAYPQTAGATLAASQGYGLNLTGTNFNGVNSVGGSSSVEVDDIAEFTAVAGGTLTGVIDENFAPGGGPSLGLALSSGTYSAPDGNGRGELSAGAGNSNNSTLNGGFNLVFYTADGVTFPFIDIDPSQVATGVFVEQNPTAASSAAAIKSTMFMAPPMFRPHVLKKKQQ
jgi:hypothetical protein